MGLEGNGQETDLCYLYHWEELYGQDMPLKFPVAQIQQHSWHLAHMRWMYGWVEAASLWLSSKNQMWSKKLQI